jgi:hypothetical protein
MRPTLGLLVGHLMATSTTGVVALSAEISVIVQAELVVVAWVAKVGSAPDWKVNTPPSTATQSLVESDAFLFLTTATETRPGPSLLKVNVRAWA